MAELRSFGLKSLKIGDVDPTGGMGQTLTDVGSIYQETCDLVSDDAQMDPIYSEQDDGPVEVFLTQGIESLKFSAMDVSPESLQLFMGGDVTGSAPNKVWESPDDTPDIEKSVEIITKRNVKITIPRARVSGKFNFKFRKRDLVLIDVTVWPLKPSDGSARISSQMVS